MAASLLALAAAGSVAGVDVTALLMAVSGAIASIAGVLLSRRGQKDAAVQQSAANRLTEQKQEHDVYRDLVTDLQTEIARLHEMHTRERADTGKLVAHLRDTIETLRTVVLSEVATQVALDATDECDQHLAEQDTGTP